MKALILSGGHGTRLRPLTYSQQKQLIPVANRPVLFYAVDDCVNAGATEIGIITGPNADQVRAAVEAGQAAGEWPGVAVRFLHQGDPRGLAHAVMVGQDLGFLDDASPFMMYLGDNILSGGIGHVAQAFQDAYSKSPSRTGASILLCPVADPTKFGVARLDDQGRVVEMIEKPKQPPSNLAIIGVYFFGPAMLRAVRQLKPSWRNEYEIVEAMQWLLDQGFSIDSRQVVGWWKDTGGPLDLLGANRLVLDGFPHQAPVPPSDDVRGRIEGRVRLGKNVRIDASSTVNGPAIVGDGARIAGSYIGPYTSVGPDCVVENATVEDSILLEGCTLSGVDGVRESLVGRGASIRASPTRAAGRSFLLGEASRVLL